MRVQIPIDSIVYTIDLSDSLDISIPVREAGITAWYVSPAKITPVRDGDWVGAVDKGAPVNFRSVNFNPHSHGTHTETFGHISIENASVHEVSMPLFQEAEVITIEPRSLNEDQVIGPEQIQLKKKFKTPVLCIRTLPNTEGKKSKNHSNTNWPYLTKDAMLYIREQNVIHLGIDTPSVDKEKDGGRLLAHKAFWNYPNAIRENATITELLYIENSIPDGKYLISLQIAPIENDAAPSRPLLYRIQEEKSVTKT